MSVTLEEVIKIMEDIAPPALAEAWDNVGLQVGDVTQSVNRILVSLDVDEKVIDEAIHLKADLILSHHPLIFHPIKNLIYNQPIGKALAKLIKHDISVFSAHTNLDIAPGGINDMLAEMLKLEEIEVLAPTQDEKLFKLVVFVPEDYLDQVRSSLCQAGAGHIGQYSHCTFTALGEGTFLPLDGTKPFLGKQGEIEKTAEYRLETIVPENKIKQVLQGMIKSHPYEEVAYDIYPTSLGGAEYGLGRIGKLPLPISLHEFSQKVKSTFDVAGMRVVGDPDQIISRVAVCGGAGMSLLSQAKSKGADCLVTGDLKYHEGQSAQTQGITVIDAGHYATEIIFVPQMIEMLNTALVQGNIDILASQINSNPWRVY